MPQPDSNRPRTLPTQPMLLPYMLPFRASDGTICLLSPERSILLRLPRSFSQVIEQVLTRIDGRSTVPQIIAAVKNDLPGTELEMVVLVLNYLFDHRMLVDGAAHVPDELDEYSRSRWNRNFSFFMPFETQTTARYDYQVALQDSSVALIGLGGTGSWTAYNLAMAGVGRITGIDGDTVSLDNLNRQVLYRPVDVGKPKVDVAAEVLAAVSPSMNFKGVSRRLESQADISRVIEGCDIVVLAADRPQGLIERWVNAACFDQRVPFVTMGLQGYYARVGPLYVPGVTGCWTCIDTDKRSKSKYYGETFEALATRSITGQPSIAPMCALVGGMAAYEAIKYLAGFVRPAVVGRELMLNTTTMKTKWLEVRQRADCPVCHVSKEGIPWRAIRLSNAPRRSLWSRLLGRF